MARQIVSGNLNTMGNAGQFETDRSTWGFPDAAAINFSRSSSQAAAGLYSCRCFNTQFSSPPYAIVGLASMRFPAQAGKKYWMKAKIFVPSANPICDSARVLSFGSSGFDTLIEETTKTVADAHDTWVEIERLIEVHTTPPFDSGHITLSPRISGAPETLANPQGFLYLDQLEVYEYIDVPDPNVCDLDIDEDATTVTNESSNGAGDGSIEVEQDGTGSYEYSKDDGQNYQPSNLFTGLTTGIYVIKVRDTGISGCEDRYPFAVNHAAVTHDFSVVVVNESVSGASDGSITLNPTGSGGPFNFTINAGVSWHSGNNFPGLAPGTYFVAVRNAAGNSVVKVVTVGAGAVSIDKVYHSRNPITFQRAAASGWESLTNYRIYNEVRVEDVADSGTYSTKMKVELVPDQNGIALFRLEEAFRGSLTATPPTANQNTIVRLTDRIKRFKNYSGDMQEMESEPASLDESLPNLVVLGGVSKFHFPSMNFFTTYIQTSKKFLTWAPTTKLVDRNQEDYLCFYVYGNFTTLKLRVKAYFDDGTDETSVTRTLTGSSYSYLYQVPAGPLNSGASLINPSKNLIKYELTMLDQTDAAISETRTYVLTKVKHPLTRYLMFLNSLGSYEVLRFTGQAEDVTEIRKEPIKKFLTHTYQALDGEFEVNMAVMSREIDYSSGHIRGANAEQWREYLKDLLLSTRVFDITDGQRLPVVILSAEHRKMDQDYNRFVRFTAKPAYDDENFTPASV